MAQIFRIALEKVVVHNVTDFEKQVCVYPVALEELIHILPRISKLYCKPSDCASLTAKFLFYNMSYVWFVVHCFAFANLALVPNISIQKRRNCFVGCLLKTAGSGKPLTPIRTKQFTPFDVNLMQIIPVSMKFTRFRNLENKSKSSMIIYYNINSYINCVLIYYGHKNNKENRYTESVFDDILIKRGQRCLSLSIAKSSDNHSLQRIAAWTISAF